MTTLHATVEGREHLQALDLVGENLRIGEVVDDMLAFSEFHIVYLSSGLYPFEPELFGELHSSRKRLVAPLDQSLFGQLRIVSKPDKALSGERR